MRFFSLSLAVVVGVCSPAVAAEPSPTTTSVADDGALLETCAALLRDAPDAARLAVIVVDTDEVRRREVERSLVRVLRSRQREDVVTPALIEARLGAAAAGQLEAAGGAMRVLAADHVVIGEVQAAADGVSLALRLVRSESGAILSTGRAQLDIRATPATSVKAQGVRSATEDLADQIAEAVERSGSDPRLLRLALAPVKAEGAAAATGKVDLLLHQELGASLKERGFLVIERARLQTAMDQLALQQLTDETGAGAVGKAIGAQSLILATVAEAGDTFVISLRVVEVEGGRITGTAQATLRREDVVSLAEVEVRTPAEAVFRSMLAPGWGQAYNGSPTKSVLFGVGTYTALASTVGLGVGAGLSYGAYLGVNAEGRTPAEASLEAKALREQTNALILATGIAAGLTAVTWTLNVGDAFLDAVD